MIINVRYNEVVLFDIEFWIAKSDVPYADWWCSDVRCVTKTRGITEFLKDNLGNENFSPYEFSDESEVLETLRKWLFEKNDNSYLDDYYNAYERQCNVFLPKLKQILENYCNKFNLSYKLF